MRRLPRRFYAERALVVAPRLLNKLLVVGDRAGRIVEVEAYEGSSDPASHAFRGPTRRNATMFGPPGHLYVYLSYGMHACANVVCGPDGVATAVLLRAVAPERGVDHMWADRPKARSERDLGSGPGKLCAALGIGLAHDGVDLVRDTAAGVFDDGVAPPAEPVTTTRVGITVAVDDLWRFYVPGDRNVSRR